MDACENKKNKHSIKRWLHSTQWENHNLNITSEKCYFGSLTFEDSQLTLIITVLMCFFCISLKIERFVFKYTL